MDLHSFSIAVPSLAGTGGAIGDLSSGAGTATLSVSQSADTTFGGAIQNGSQKLLALTKTGTGELTLTGSNTYAGPTTIGQGELDVDGWQANSAVTVNGGTLGGTGTVGSVTVNAGGHLAPGDLNAGVLVIAGNLAFKTGELDIAATGGVPASASVSANLTLSGAALDINGSLGPGPYTIVNYGGAQRRIRLGFSRLRRQLRHGHRQFDYRLRRPGAQHLPLTRRRRHRIARLRGATTGD